MPDTDPAAGAADWPRHWYARRGFREIGRMHVFDRVQVRSAWRRGPRGGVGAVCVEARARWCG
ncbi:hypothetical protein [Streptomyces roseoverticillatus]|uniref:Uncharacterized protein n=1 Tax=Streptomyces roseoverticillatus TaxID=66429 RepID=A0ABV3J259_9ACTN